MTKSNLGRKEFIWLMYPESQSLEGSQGSSSNRAGELMQRPWRGAAYRLALHGLLGLLSFSFLKMTTFLFISYVTVSVQMFDVRGQFCGSQFSLFTMWVSNWGCQI